MRRSLLALLVVLAATPAHANGRFPTSTSVTVRPGDVDDLYLAVTFGFLVSEDDGRTWRWLCEESIGYSGTFDPKYAVAPDGTIYATTFDGLRVSRDRGCTFETAPDLPGIWVDAIDVASDGTVWIGTAESGLPNAVYRSRDRGATLEEMGLVSSTAWWKSLEIAPSDPQRIYVTGYQVAPDVRVFVERSVDGGKTWESMPVDGLLLGSEPLVLLEGVDPIDPDILYLRSVGAFQPDGDRLYRSADGGATWAPVLDTEDALRAFAIRGDGGVVAGTVPQGDDEQGCTYTSVDRGVTFGACVPGPQMACAVERADGTLFACGANWEPDLFALGRSTDAASWSKVFRFHEMAGPLACPKGTVQRDTCEGVLWPTIAEQFGVTGPPDGMPPDGGTSGGGGSGGCCDAGRRGGGGAVALALAVALVVWRRRDDSRADPLRRRGLRLRRRRPRGA